MERSLKSQILADLNDKMVLLAGPRQVGKTTLARSLFKNTQYLNWDVDEDRSHILSRSFHPADLWIFDEIHKYKTWRNYLKGLYDKLGNQQKILVTGSAKLDVLRKGGDSLQGRYHFLRLMPLSFKELGMRTTKDTQQLFELSGFPEPFFSQSKSKSNRWSRSYRERIIRQEVATNELIQDLGNMEILLHRLPELVGGTLSINAISEDIQISHKTLSKWISALERLYAVFRISPFGPPKVKAVKKEQKLFFFDWNAIVDPGGRFENFVAVHLLKWIYFEQDVNGRNLDLRFYKDKAQREVDFVIIENNRPIFFIEAKYGDSEITQGIKYLKQRFPMVRAMQVHLQGKKEYQSDLGIEYVHVNRLLSELI
ncbi:MAG TPA: ATP-binding protein [Pseudobdellovibrionaceae bacterium]